MYPQNFVQFLAVMRNLLGCFNLLGNHERNLINAFNEASAC